ncbi:MAG: hypothetical protein IJ565_00390 [Bacilli bacterium]|nr:hypothetical protein [Bacilli bacterium]
MRKFLFLILTLLFIPLCASAAEYDIYEDTIRYYGTINYSFVYSEANTKSVLASKGNIYERVAILGNATNADDLNDDCINMYSIIYQEKVAYVCANNVINIVSAEILETSNITYNYDRELSKFPESYRSYIDTLHQQHPNWRFYAINTYLEYSDVVNYEKNANYIDSTTNNVSYFDTLEAINYNYQNETYVYHKDGKWVTPSTEATAYFIDPRNYLTEEKVFVFEDSRTYSYQTPEPVKQILKYVDNNEIDYADVYKHASNFSKLSPLTLIARARLENTTYTGNVNEQIVEKATYLATKYTYNGQETQYFQKFNVNPNTLSNTYAHQYETNIENPIVEASYIYEAYKEADALENSIVFHIPVYNNMPGESSIKPLDGNPNNWLSTITINDEPIDNFDGDNYYSYDNNWDGEEDAVYPDHVITYNAEWDAESITIDASAISEEAGILGTGEISLPDKETIVDLVVMAENNTTKTYRVVIVKNDPPYPDIDWVLSQIAIKYDDKYLSGLSIGSDYNVLKDAITNISDLVTTEITPREGNTTGTFATGDMITVTSGPQVRNFTYVLYGDLNGSATISIIDLVAIRNIILDESNLEGAYREAGDVNRDGKVSILDLVAVRNDLLGTHIVQLPQE